jgi:hypothetical protein
VWFRAEGLGSRADDWGSKVYGIGLRFWSSWSRVQGSGFRVEGLRLKG